MTCSHPITVHEVKYPCGKCLSCRKARRKDWMMRLEHELHTSKDAIFLTLTYDDDHMPDNASLVKADLQKFYKRLRRKLEPRRIRYYSAGEYGTRTIRPHYHSIIYGLSLLPVDKQLVMSCWDKCDWRVDTIRDKSFGSVTPESISYVTGYIADKLSNRDNKLIYIDTNREIPFQLCSKGLGRDYVAKYTDELMENIHIKKQGKELPLPRYYRKKLNIERSNNERFDQLCEENERSKVRRALGLELLEDELTSIELLEFNKVQDRQGRQQELNIKAKLAIKSRQKL